MNESIKFAEWIEENHFRLYNIKDGVYYWESEDELLTTEQLYERWGNTNTEIPELKDGGSCIGDFLNKK